MPKYTSFWLALTVIALGLTACTPGGTPPPTATPPPLAQTLTLYNWVDYMPAAVLDDFTAEYGVKINYVTYDSMEEAVNQIKAGLPYDVAVLENDRLPALVAEGRLAAIDHRHIPNFKNISANFRDLQFDPGNAHSVPYNWGSTGLLVRSDLVQEPVTGWADLWQPQFAGKIAMRAQAVESLSIALKALGYPLNSEDPAQLAAALAHLTALKPSLHFVDVENETATAGLLSGQDLILVGWTGDALYAQAQNPAVTYVFPEDGIILWGDNFVISANSANQYTAELFINFLLRPEISARIINEYYYPSANEAGMAMIDPQLREKQVLFPPQEILTGAEWYLPLSPAGEKLYEDLWEQFINSSPTEK